MTRVLVCGGRNFGIKFDRDGNEISRNHAEVALLIRVLDELYEKEDFKVLIEGEANGADKTSAWWAKAYDIEIAPYPAKWNLYGRSAGYVRNQQMLDEGKPDLVIAFPGGKGTMMMTRLASTAGVKVVYI